MVARRQATWVEKSIRVFLVSLILVTLAAGLVAYWGTVQAQGAEFAAGDDVTVDTDFLNFRAGAGLSFSVIVVLKRGIELKVVAGPTAANGYTWYEVRTKTNASGWVAGEYLALEKTWTDFAVGDLALIDVQALNCRSGPGLNAGVIYVMEGGTQVTILDGPNTVDGYHWYKVETDDGDIGWAAGEFLRSPPVVPHTEFGKGQQVVVDTDYLNLRAGAGLSHTAVNVLESGTALIVSNGPMAADGYEWYEVETREGQLGWVASTFLAPAPGLGFAVGDAVRVSNGAQNLRERPGLNSAVIRLMANGELLQVRGGPVEANGYTWYRVWNYSGEGWAAGEFLRIDPNGWPEEGGA